MHHILADLHPPDKNHEMNFKVEKLGKSTSATRTGLSFQQLLPDDLSQAEITDNQQELRPLLLSYSDVLSARDQVYGGTPLVTVFRQETLHPINREHTELHSS